jgi:hypothetical protein
MRLMTGLCAILILSGLAFSQVQVVRGYNDYGYGPYVPMTTTPQISFQQVSPGSAGASNATYGLVAGAENSTASESNADTSSTYTEALWYAGGGMPQMSSRVSIFPHEMRGPGMHEMMMHGHGREHAEAPSAQWTYFASSMEESSSAVDAAAAAKSGRKASRTITNQDIDQENQKTGNVKYDGKTEKIQ